jgi:hypothetical protein
MSKFILTYRYPADHTARTDADSLGAWKTFLEEIGGNVVDPGWPVFDEPAVVGNAGPATKLAGYSVIEVDDMAAAIAVARRCPTLSNDGGVEIGALAELRDDHAAEVQRRRLGQG